MTIGYTPTSMNELYGRNVCNTGYNVFINPKYAFGSIYETKVQKALKVDKQGLKIYTKSMGIGQDVHPKKAWKFLKKQNKFYQDMVSRMYLWQAMVAKGNITEETIDEVLDYVNKHSHELGE